MCVCACVRACVRARVMKTKKKQCAHATHAVSRGATCTLAPPPSRPPLAPLARLTWTRKLREATDRRPATKPPGPYAVAPWGCGVAKKAPRKKAGGRMGRRRGKRAGTNEKRKSLWRCRAGAHAHAKCVASKCCCGRHDTPPILSQRHQAHPHRSISSPIIEQGRTLGIQGRLWSGRSAQAVAIVKLSKQTPGQRTLV